jgi:hypothetical protein
VETVRQVCRSTSLALLNYQLPTANRQLLQPSEGAAASQWLRNIPRPVCSLS